MSRPTFDSLKIRPHVGRDTILFKEAQAGMPAGGPGGYSEGVGVL